MPRFRSRMKKYSVRVLFFFAASLTVVIGNSITVGGSPSDLNQQAPYERLRQAASDQGKVRVIAKLDVPAIEELTAESRKYRTVLPEREFLEEGRQADAYLKGAIQLIAEAVLAILPESEFELNHMYSSIPYIALEVSPLGLAILESLPEVIDIQEDIPIRLIEPISDSSPAENGSSAIPSADLPLLNNTVNIIGASNAWSMGYTGAGWYVAILDTGIRKTHQFFTGKTVVEACFALGEDGVGPAGDCPNGNSTMIGPGAAVHYPSTYYAYDHGTHVSGIAAGSYGTLHGVAREANIIAVQVFSKFSAAYCGGSPCVMSWNSDSAAGLDYIYSIRGSYSIACVNMSLGGGAYSSPCNGDIRKAAIDNLRAVGIATAIATGNNSYCGSVSAPACISTSVAVGASTDADQRSSFSNWHATMQKFFAPGSSVYSSTGSSDSSYASWSGTSMATPHVTGAWALLKQAHPAGTVDEFLAVLQPTGFGITTSCDGYTVPIPRIQVDEAINCLLPSVTVDSPNGGEYWKLGASRNITWSKTGLCKNIYIFLQQNGTPVALIDKNLDPSTGTYPWTVGDCRKGSISPGSNFKVVIREHGSSVRDESDSGFTIQPSITVISPNGGESWPLGSSQNITWTSQGLTGKVAVVLYEGSTLVALIAKVDGGLGSYVWTVGDCRTGSVPTSSNLSVVIYHIDTGAKDRSDGVFTITP